MHSFSSKNQAWDFPAKQGVLDSQCIPVPAKTRARVWDSLCMNSPAKLGFGTYNALFYHTQTKLGLGTLHNSQQNFGFGTHNAFLSQQKTWPWDSQCINFQAKTRVSKPRAWDPQCLGSKTWDLANSKQNLGFGIHNA